MAVTETAQPTKMLDRTMARLAGGVSIVLLAAAMATTIVYMALQTDAATWLWAAAAAKMVFQCLLMFVSVQLLRERKWAQQVLLILWTVVLAETFILLLSVLLWGQPQWLTDMMDWNVLAVAIPAMACSVVAVVLLVQASRAASRVRYASMVIVSIVAALVVAIVVNMIAQDTDSYVRIDVGTLERYGLSDRTRKILASLDKNLRLTCVYTSEDEDKKADTYRPRTLELLEEIQGVLEKAGKSVEVVNVATVAQKARLDARLRGKQLAGQSEHVKVLEDFLTRSKSMSAEMRAQEQRWASMPGDSYLAMWGLTGEISGACRKRAEVIDQLALQTAPKLTGSGLPDCAKLVDSVKGAMEDVKDSLAGALAGVNLISTISPTVAKRRGSVQAALEDAVQGADAALKALGDDKTAAGGDPTKMLVAFTTSARQAAEKIRKAADDLAQVGGADNSPVVRGSRLFAHDQKIMTAYGEASIRSDLVQMLKQYVAAPMDDMAGQADALVKNAKSSFQAEAIPKFRKSVAANVKLLTTIHGKATTALAALSKVDKPTQAIFDQAKAGKLLAAVIDPATKLLDRIEKLPEIKSNSLTEDVAKENIVILELGDETRVVTFDQIWPQRGGPRNPMAPRKKIKRTFNGDSAIGSKILAMGHEPFATILLTYYEFKIPPQMARQMPPQPPSPLPPALLQTLKTALTDARFEVKEWNLAGGQKPELDEGTPKILIVLPAASKSPMTMMGGAQQMPSFGPAEMDKIRQEIDSGTPAVFMAMYLPEMMQTPYGMPMRVPQYQHMGKYLRDEWGIDVRHTHILIKGIANIDEPGRFKLDIDGINYLPISTFTEHAIGAPLRGQRVLWTGACPIARTAGVVEGVTIEPVLTVPDGVTNVWASKDLERLGRLFRNQELISVDPAAGDLTAPMDLALAATRAGNEDEKRSGARVVVLGMGFSMIDGYVNSPRRVRDKTGDSVEDPPRANTDLVVNSAYWLSGRQQFIAAGPTRLKPIAAIGAGEMLMLRILCLGVLPLMIGLAGGVVLYARRH